MTNSPIAHMKAIDFAQPGQYTRFNMSSLPRRLKNRELSPVPPSLVVGVI